MSTPYLDEAERCHRVALLHDGKRLALDTPDALRRSLPGRMLEVMVADQARAIPVIQSVASVVDVRAFGERVHVRLSQDAGPDAVTRVTQALEGAGFRVTSARTVQASLEDVFIARLEEAATQGR